MRQLAPFKTSLSCPSITVFSSVPQRHTFVMTFIQLCPDPCTSTFLWEKTFLSTYCNRPWGWEGWELGCCGWVGWVGWVGRGGGGCFPQVSTVPSHCCPIVLKISQKTETSSGWGVHYSEQFFHLKQLPWMGVWPEMICIVQKLGWKGILKLG
jgi:hypothetical protein